MPKTYREKVGDKEFAEKPIGTGSFKWVDYKQDHAYALGTTLTLWYELKDQELESG